MSNTDIAIVGAACRLPGAPDLTSLGELLFSGSDAVSQIPEDRWTKRAYHDLDPHQAGKSYTFAAGCLDAIDRFDAGFFGMSPRETIHTDPQQRLLLELAYEAFEDAGQRPSSFGGRDMAVFVGGSSWDYALIKAGDISLMESHSMQGMSLSSLSNRLSYVFDLSGPSLTVDTACSSALVALNLGCRAIRRGEADSALVGAVNLLISPQNFVGFSRAAMLSPTGRCHPFDARADGYVRSEGGGVVVLKRLTDAIADGDDIRAVIRGSGVNSDGRTSSFSVPGRDAQTRLLLRTYEEAGVTPDELSYLEAHGTGTPVGDPIEAAALGAGIARRRRDPLLIGSIKSNIGHLEAASGMAGLMKLLTVLDRRAVPASLNCETPNPNIPFTELNLEVVREARALEPGPGRLTLGINSFGFGGANAHAILSEPPAAIRQPDAAFTGMPPLLISAKTEAALRALVQDWSERLQTRTPGEAADLARAAARRRDSFSHRLAITTARPENMAEELTAWLDGEAAPSVVAGQAASGGVALVYAGNGSQWAGMGMDAYAHSSIFRDTIAEIDGVFVPLAGWSLSAVMRNGSTEADLQQTAMAQPLLFALQVGVTAALRAAGVQVQAVMGHSVGEVAAAWASGALTLAQATEVTFHRSRLQQTTHGHGGMAVLSLDPDSAQTLIDGTAPGLEIAAINGPDGVTVAGPEELLGRLQTAARAAGRAFLRLPLAYAFHSSAMDSLKTPLKEALAGLASHTPQIPMISTTAPGTITAGSLDAEYWWRNIRSPVLFAQGVERLVKDGVRIFIEIGPKPILQSYLKAGLKRAAVDGAVLESLTKAPVGRDPFPVIAAHCYAAGVDITGAAVFDGPTNARALPAYPWQRQRFWMGSTVEGLDLNSPPDDHPLLGFRRDNANRTWSNVLSVGRMPWLADHSIDGVPVLPAAAMVDMALAAARVRHPDAAAVEISDFEMMRPLLVEGAREIAFEMVTPETFELSSRQRLSNEDRVIYARGRIVATPNPAPLYRRVADTPVSSDLDSAAFYDRIADLEITYGPEFRPIEHARTYGPDDVEVAFLPVDSRTTLEDGWLLDPRLLDGALQALFATRSKDMANPGDSILPWRFGRVRLLRPGAQPVAAACRLTRAGPKAHCADIALLDAEGEVIAELLQCWFVRVRPGEARPADHKFWRAMTPCARQPAATAIAPPVPRTGAETPGLSESEILAHAYVTAVAYNALAGLARDGSISPQSLAAEGRLSPEGRDLLDILLGWLEEDDLAQAQGSQWSLAPDSGLPAPAEIWQSLLFDEPSAVAEISLAAIVGDMLPKAIADGPEALTASALFRQQMLDASPTAEAGRDALGSALDDRLASWPVERPLRVAVLGEPSAPLVRRVLTAIDAAGVAARLAIIAGDNLSPSLAAELRQRPGVTIGKAQSPVDPAHRYDLVVGAYALSLGQTTWEKAVALLAPDASLLLVEAEPSRLWLLANRLSSRSIPAADRVRQLAGAGCRAATWSAVGGAVWTAALIAATAPVTTPALPHDLTLTLFAGGPSSLAGALSAIPGVALKPLADLGGISREEGAEAERDIILIPADGAALPDLARFCGTVAQRAAAMAGAGHGRIWLVIQGDFDDPASQGLAGLRRVMTNEGLDARFLCVANGVSAARVIDEIALADDEREVFLDNHGRRAPRLRLGLPAPAAGGGPRRLEVARPGLLGSLTWQPFKPRPPGAGEVAVQVHASALNFRDVMWALGVLPDEALMDGFSGPTLGLECAGVVTAVGDGVTQVKVGDRIAALAPSALATDVITSANAVLPIQADMDFKAAATLPVTAMTVIYALGHLGRLRRGERVLIHGGLGGVGLAAIQYARHLGAEILATAGSPERRLLLRAMGVEHVFDSRNPQFADEILTATGGEGVDVVLNSLSGEMMQQSLKLMKPFGRFLEIGKRDFYANSEIGLRPLRHNVTYFAIDVDQLPLLRPDVAGEVLAEAADLLASRALRPLPYRAFAAVDVVDAFRLIQGSGHVGKIVVTPDRNDAAPPAASAAFTVRSDRTYVVTGGAAGFGLETARWLAERGARNLALLSRRGLATEGAEAVLDTFAAQGVDARVYACDVAEESDLAAILAEIRVGQPAIGGVVHAAMVMDDALLGDLEPKRFETSLLPKLAGADALDRLTRNDPIELFVLYSSISAAIGNPGQGNYVVANAAMEAVARRRAAAGLPALAVQWGPISDAGFLARDTRVRELLARVLASGDLTARAALDALPGMVEAGLPVIGHALADWATLKGQMPIGATTLMSEAADGEAGRTTEVGIRDQIVSLPANEAQALIEGFLVDEVSAILRLDRDAVDVGRPISQMGFDSLMILELHLAVEQRLRCDLPLMSVGGGATLRSIAVRVMRGMRGEPDVADDGDELQDHLMRHETLPEAQGVTLPEAGE